MVKWNTNHPNARFIDERYTAFKEWQGLQKMLLSLNGIAVAQVKFTRAVRSAADAFQNLAKIVRD